MARTRKVAKKITGVVSTPEPTRNLPGKVVQVQFSFIISTGKDDARSIEELRDDLRRVIMENTDAKSVTPVQGYYLVDGKVCLPDDYDPETRDFKPGKYPPRWAGGPDEKEILARIEREQNLDSLSRNPAHLRTAKETARLRDLEEKQPRTAAAALDDFYENTERGREIAAERERKVVEGRRASASRAKPQPKPEPSECEDCGLEIDDCECEEYCQGCGMVEDQCCCDDSDCDDCGMPIDECECESVDVEDINDAGKMNAALEDVTQSAIQKLRAGRTVVRKR